jgi:putative phosphoribosyl transferase
MERVPARFIDRSEAGRLLGARLAAMNLLRPIIYALPRGGVPVGLAIARALSAPLDLVLVRKIGAPGAPELALGAVVDGENPQTVINQDVWQASGADAAFLAGACQRELAEIKRRRALYREGRLPIDPAGCTAVVVDDGLATGATAKAALAAIKRQGAARTILAVPVAPEETLADMRSYANEIVCLHSAARFHGVGAFYDDFHQLTDKETVGLLRQAWMERPADAAALAAGPSQRPIEAPPLGLLFGL